MSTSCKHVPSAVASSRVGQDYYERRCTKCGARQRGTMRDGKITWRARWRGGSRGFRIVREAPGAFPLSVVVPLAGSRRVQVELRAFDTGEVEVRSRDAGTLHCVEKRQRVVGKDAQEFYEQLLVLLGYEVPRVELREDSKGRLSVRRSEHVVAGRPRARYDLTCRFADLYVGITAGGDLLPVTIHASFGQRRALELCRALAEPLGWELTE